MTLARMSWCAALLGVLLVGACSKPTGPGVHTVTGHVTLIGYLVDDSSKFAGTRVVGDADDVPVELVYGDRVVARTLTVNGAYRFTGIGPGGYRARTAAGPLLDETNTLTIADDDIMAADTLRLVAAGNLFPVPNPMQSDMRVVFYLSDTARVDIRVADLAGLAVRHIVADSTILPGTKVAGWDGNDDSGHRVSAGMYWLIFHAEGPTDPVLTNDRIALLFR